MNLHLSYAVSFEDFCKSLRQYQQRSHWANFVYYLDVWVLPLLGAAVVIIYVYGLATHNEIITYALDWLSLVGLIACVGLPTLYRLRIRRTYRQRTVLAEGGKVRLEANETGIRFLIDGKADVRYEWETFSDYSEDRDVMTLFVQQSAFHTIPSRDVSQADWSALQQLVSRHVRRL